MKKLKLKSEIMRTLSHTALSRIRGGAWVDEGGSGGSYVYDYPPPELQGPNVSSIPTSRELSDFCA